MLKRIMAQCRTQIKRDAVTRQNIDDVEHVIISSATLPDDIVMNGGLYPADEIAASFLSLERTLAPVEHPHDADGNFLSANDPIALHNFHAGAFNANVRRENGRVFIDKVINVQEAKKTDRGKRLLDRIEELETNAEPRPIHTSVGVFLEVEELDGPTTNSAGQEYTWIARNMVFDHDAILLDSIGAAQPHQGVGMAVNRSGEECTVNQHTIVSLLPLADSDTVWNKDEAAQRVKEHGAAGFLWGNELPFVDIIDGEAKAVPAALRSAAARLSQIQGPSTEEKTAISETIDLYLNQLKTNSLLHSEIESALSDAIRLAPLDGDYVVDFTDTDVVFESGTQIFSAPYILDGKRARIVGLPLPVERDMTYTPKTNQKGDIMKELMLKALADAGVTVNADMTDDEVMAKYTALLVSSNSSDDDGASDDKALIADVVANALKPLLEKVADLEAKTNSKDDAELTRLADIVGNSEKYPGLDTEAAKTLGAQTLSAMAANCANAYGIPLTIVNSNDDDMNKSYDMPE